MGATLTDYTAILIDDMEAIYGGSFKRARASLGVTAFGLSVIDLPPNIDRLLPHVHTFDGQEELYFALKGGGFIEINGEPVPIDDQTMIRVGPTAVRRPISGPDGISLLCIGATPGQPYTPFINSEAGTPELPIPDLPGIRAAVDAEGEDDFCALKIAEMDNYNQMFFRVRKSLDISAFGISLLDYAPGHDKYPRHDETSTGQEEVYIALSGDGELEIGDEMLPFLPGAMIRVGPTEMRKVFAGQNGLRFITLGGTPGQPYEQPDFSKIVKQER